MSTETKAVPTYQRHSVGIHRGEEAAYWCASCGDVKRPCEHFPALLTAAPEMLEALKALLSAAIHNSLGDCAEAWSKAEAAINKAEGQ